MMSSWLIIFWRVQDVELIEDAFQRLRRDVAHPLKDAIRAGMNQPVADGDRIFREVGLASPPAPLSLKG